ncbi:MAG: DinB family protein [Pseudomonadota bacterium]
MITPEYLKTMSRYNAWQNASLYDAADALSDLERRKDRGAIFKSIHQTLCHLLWGDQIWMNRFADTSLPIVSSVAESVSMIEDWDTLKSERKTMDSTISKWSESVSQAYLDAQTSWYSGSQKRDLVSNNGGLVVHMFNHQTHHRGQVHAMLTAAGAEPDDTDLFIMQFR